MPVMISVQKVGFLAIGLALVLSACTPTPQTPAAGDVPPPASGSVVDKKAEWTLYHSLSHGYSFWYPSTWILDNSDEEGPTLTVTLPDEQAIFSVSSLADQRLAQEGGLDAVFVDIHAGFDQDERYTIADYNQGPETGALLAGVYITHGGFADGGIEYRFKETGILLRDGQMFITSAYVEQPSVALYGEILDEIMGSFDPFGLKDKKPKMVL